jgi:RNA polymerase sigma-70 factor (ECF subfamily)
MDPLSEVAAYCGMSESRAKSMLFRTRQKLKEYLKKEGFVT